MDSHVYKSTILSICYYLLEAPCFTASLRLLYFCRQSNASEQPKTEMSSEMEVITKLDKIVLLEYSLYHKRQYINTLYSWIVKS